MMIGGAIGMALIDPERETTRLAKRAALVIEPT